MIQYKLERPCGRYWGNMVFLQQCCTVVVRVSDGTTDVIHVIEMQRCMYHDSSSLQSVLEITESNFADDAALYAVTRQAIERLSSWKICGNSSGMRPSEKQRRCQWGVPKTTYQFSWMLVL